MLAARSPLQAAVSPDAAEQPQSARRLELKEQLAVQRWPAEPQHVAELPALLLAD